MTTQRAHVEQRTATERKIAVCLPKPGTWVGEFELPAVGESVPLRRDGRTVLELVRLTELSERTVRTRVESMVRDRRVVRFRSTERGRPRLHHLSEKGQRWLDQERRRDHAERSARALEGLEVIYNPNVET